VSTTPQQSHHFSIRDLRANFNGEVIGPDDAAYDEARQVFFKGVDRHPAAVVRVAGADDVARVVTFARENGLELAVRSGGHHRAVDILSGEVFLGPFIDHDMTLDRTPMPEQELDPKALVNFDSPLFDLASVMDAGRISIRSSTRPTACICASCVPPKVSRTCRA
jgi:hypothetical protein